MLLLNLAACFGITSCFVAGTVVDTPGGPRRIETLVVGDTVWAFDVATLRRVARPVTAVHSSHVTAVRRIALDDRVLTCSGEHPLWSSGAWVAAKELAADSPVHVWNGRECTEQRVVSVTDEPGPIRVFNISVDGEETYFANGVLVHNKSIAFPDTARPFPHTGLDTADDLVQGDTRDFDEQMKGAYGVWQQTRDGEVVCRFSWPAIGVTALDDCASCLHAWSVEFAPGSTTEGDCAEFPLEDGADISALGGPLEQGIGIGWDGQDHWLRIDGAWEIWPEEIAE